MSVILGEDGQSMKLTFVTVKDSQCSHGIRVVGGLLHAYRRGGKVTANLKRTEVIYPYMAE